MHIFRDSGPGQDRICYYWPSTAGANRGHQILLQGALDSYRGLAPCYAMATALTLTLTLILRFHNLFPNSGTPDERVDERESVGIHREGFQGVGTDDFQLKVNVVSPGS